MLFIEEVLQLAGESLYLYVPIIGCDKFERADLSAIQVSCYHTPSMLKIQMDSDCYSYSLII